MPTLVKKKSPSKNNPKPDPNKQAKKESKQQKGKKGAQPVVEREVLYPEREVHLMVDDKAFHEQLAKDILGWEEVPEGKHDIVDLEGKKVRLNNNIANRPLDIGKVHDLVQTILGWDFAKDQRIWQFNFEPITVGRTGLVCNGQHQMIALVYACQRYRKDSDKYPWFKTEPTIDKMLCRGSSEDDGVVNTMDTGRQRTLADILYRSEYFQDMEPADRNVISKMCGYAIRFVWDRTGVANAYTLRRTLTELLHFLDNHMSICKAVKHIFSEDKGKNTIKHLFGSSGNAAGFMYLMGTSTSDPQKYREAQHANEDVLDKSLWDAAENFWVELSDENTKLGKAVRAHLSSYVTEEGDEEITNSERRAIIAKAWQLYAEGKPITAEKLVLEYVEDSEGVKTLAEFPTVGGIDLGESKVQPEPDPSTEEINQRADKLRERKVMKPPKIGQSVSVTEENGEEWFGRLKDIYDGPTGQIAKVEEAGSKKIFETAYANCQQLKKDLPDDKANGKVEVE